MESSIELLSESKMMPILLFISEHPGCSKSDIYVSVSRNGTVPSKLDKLEAAGLITQVPIEHHTGRVIIDLTDKGRKVAEAIITIRDIMEG